MLVKRDLNRLEGEKQAYLFRKNELQNGQKNMKGMTTICVGSMVFLMILLAILGITFGMDVTMGYLIAVINERNVIIPITAHKKIINFLFIFTLPFDNIHILTIKTV